MPRLNIRTFAAPLAFLLLIPYQSFGQSALPEEILKWEADISFFDSLNLVEATDDRTPLIL
ncbi:MAG: hypothetical protein U9R49_10825 [Bacteroidota bacterium]|nr:hypothetical protein [Bacteroidota bacterium]